MHLLVEIPRVRAGLPHHGPEPRHQLPAKSSENRRKWNIFILAVLPNLQLPPGSNEVSAEEFIQRQKKSSELEKICTGWRIYLSQAPALCNSSGNKGKDGQEERKI